MEEFQDQVKKQLDLLDREHEEIRRKTKLMMALFFIIIIIIIATILWV